MLSLSSCKYVLIGMALLYGSCLVKNTQAADEYELKMIDNSKSYSQAIAINAKCEILGTREVMEGPGITLKPYFRSTDTDVQLNPPTGFTNLEPQALSDNGLVIGYVSRPAGNVNGSLRGFVWDSKTGEMSLLEPLPNDIGSHAQDISADGKRITGYCTGHTPARMRPCLWQWQEDSKTYIPQALSSIIQNNPYLQSGQVIISPNGKRIAACITEEQLSDFMFDSSLYAWECTESGEWQRKKLSDEQPKLKDMNDQGTMVGVTTGETAGRACIIDPDGKIELIELLPDDETNVAYGINNAGTVVGMSDDPRGGEGGPQAFIWRNGVVEPLRLFKSTVDSSALAINQDGAIAGFMLKDANEDSSIVSFVRTLKK
jgi:probable HAF family extracellular repeat protein